MEIINRDMYGFKPFDRKIRSYAPWLADTENKRPSSVNLFSETLSHSFQRPKARCAALVLPLLS